MSEHSDHRGDTEARSRAVPVRPAIGRIRHGAPIPQLLRFSVCFRGAHKDSACAF